MIMMMMMMMVMMMMMMMMMAMMMKRHKYYDSIVTNLSSEPCPRRQLQCGAVVKIETDDKQTQIIFAIKPYEENSDE